MSSVVSLIPELEDVVQHGTAERRNETLTRITNLFLSRAEDFSEEHVQLFDDVFGRLIIEIETRARAELALRLAPIANAPLELLRRLASDDDIAVAGPVLAQSPRLDDRDLVRIARTKSQSHLIAISGRPQIGETVTDVLMEVGDEDVVRKIADNHGARFSDAGLSSLVIRAEQDEFLAESIGQRSDIPPHLFTQLLNRATAVVQKRLLATARPETRVEIKRVLAKIASEVAASSAATRDYSAAQHTVYALVHDGKLDELQLAEFAANQQFEEAVVSLAELCKVPLEVVDRLMDGDRPDPVLILCKASGFGWSTARAIIMARPNRAGSSSAGLDTAFGNFDRLSPATAQRVVRFWQVGYGSGRSVN